MLKVCMDLEARGRDIYVSVGSATNEPAARPVVAEVAMGPATSLCRGRKGAVKVGEMAYEVGLKHSVSGSLLDLGYYSRDDLYDPQATVVACYQCWVAAHSLFYICSHILILNEISV